jgi:hypothetical protein
MTMMVERSGSCSTVVAPFDLVDELLGEAAAEFVPEA